MARTHHIALALTAALALAAAPVDADYGTGAPPDTQGCTADLDGSGWVDLTDVLIVVLCWAGDGSVDPLFGERPDYCERSDATRDGVVGMDDLLHVLRNYGASCDG